MHTCTPPKDALDKWLDEYPNFTETYGHLLLEQKLDISSELVKDLRPYFESAHLDARKHFHEYAGIDLHPDAETEESNVQYPNCLPLKAINGLFGEVMCGMVSEAYKMVGEHNWSIPVFLFRMHADVEAYIFKLARNPTAKREVFGRFGSDFIGLALEKDGAIKRIIVGEAKWRKILKPSSMEQMLLGKWVNNPENKEEKIRSGGIWHEINNDPPLPHGLRQLQKLLQDCDANKYSNTILSMQEALLIKNNISIPRTDLILIIGNAAPTRNKKTPFIPSEKQPVEYIAGHDLQIVEIVLNEGERLIKDLYQSLYG